MKGEKDKNPAQVVLTKEEYNVVRRVAIYRGFSSVNKYLRNLIEIDVSAAKKGHPHPEVFGTANTYEFSNLSPKELEVYLNQIAPVKPHSIDFYLKEKTGGGPVNVKPSNNDLGL